MAVVAAAAIFLAVPAAPRGLPDREASIVLVQGMAVEVDHATFFDDGGIIALRVRNGHYEPALAHVRVAVFDESLRLKGSLAYCTGILQPTTRQPVLIPLEVRGATTRDTFVVVVEEVVTSRRVVSLREPLNVVLAQLRARLDQRMPALTTTEAARSGEIPPCECECEPAAASAEQGCGDAGPIAFTCTPMLPGCSQAFTCRR